MLTLTSITTKYGDLAAVRDVSLTVGAGELVCLIGPNGAGKTTALNSIVGLLRPASGSIQFEGQEIIGKEPDQLLRMGIALVPEHRRIFTNLTVLENLMVGGSILPSKLRHTRAKEMTDLFPILGEKAHMAAGYLSGGQAQMLAIARALMTEPRLLLMDEPSLGLAPLMVILVFDTLEKLTTKERGLLIVEQNARRALQVATHAYLLRTGAIVERGTGQELLNKSDLFETYFGG
jgi:branched-chain amino acid transport system ATP-binding protein